MELEVQANAKINLTLDILGVRDDGYHDLDGVMQEIALHDTLTIENGRGGFVLFCDHPHLKLDENNLIYKAWDALRDRVEDDSIIIELEKRIPLSAGLGGGSADAAATLVGLNRIWNLNLTEEELIEIAGGIDSDTAFFIRGGTQRAQGRGNILTPLPNYSQKPVLLVNTGDTISSRYVYDRVEANGKIPVSKMIDLLQYDNLKAYTMMKNQMESVSFESIPKLAEIKEKLEESGALAALMSGSGPTMFGLYETMEQAEDAYTRFQGRYPFVLLTRTV
ncbi:4-(cytidine 5'-diphospho)-2-C-methyl-D-erythritol kinase [Murdochiella massiliensis]|uniref:4-(cytidine 5'-diphospho)-2-C-methyl-D-erythritol kinase n=1 Tax=Murdochiella massiliensis TaxID=1673723 RepID=UPI00082D805A|nr:4-(cytidine 5'-diphospho)-2-C-methyl-D-erythritol kinase [Murdochiella massiliensis]